MNETRMKGWSRTMGRIVSLFVACGAFFTGWAGWADDASAPAPFADSISAASHESAEPATPVGTMRVASNQIPVGASNSSTSTVGAAGVSPSPSLSSSPDVASPAVTTGANPGTPLASPGQEVSATLPQPVARNESPEGKFPVTFSLSFASIYDDNIYITHDNPVDDFYWQITPGVAYSSNAHFTPGNDSGENPEHYFHASYDPTFSEFLNHTNNNSIDHNAVAGYQLTLARLKLGFTQSYVTSHLPNLDYGGRLPADYYTTRIFADYVVDKHLTVGAELNQDLNRYQTGQNAAFLRNSNVNQNSNEWNGGVHADFQVAPKTTVGAGVVLGYVDVAHSPSQVYEQFLGRVGYKVTNKIEVDGQFGFETREYNATGNSPTVDPVFGLAASYHPFDSTLLQVNARRASVPSISMPNSNYYSSTVGVTVRQRLLHHFYLQFDGNYENDSYYNTGNNSNGTGLDYNYFVLRPSLEWKWNKYFDSSLFYERDQNLSSTTSSSFQTNSVGLKLSVNY